MRTNFTLLSLCTLISLNAQTTALDFTANDCDGVPHNLFSELDAGNAVILEIVMMGCQPCIDAAHSITDNVLPNVSDPTRVKYYSIGYTNSITCTQINNWKNNNGFTHQVFAGMSAQTTYYGGMGMPTVVVLGGGSGHGVYYNELGHSDSDNPAIIDAVNAGLADANSIPDNDRLVPTISPNPAHDVLNITGAVLNGLRIMDIHGREVLTVQVRNGRADISDLAPGSYVAMPMNGSMSGTSIRFEKR